MFAIVGDITSKLCKKYFKAICNNHIYKKSKNENEELNEVSQVIVACGQQFLLVQIKKRGVFHLCFIVS